MTKKSHPRKQKKAGTSRYKTPVYYFRISFMSVFLAFAVYSIGSYIFPPAPPCANSKSCTTDLAEKIENGATGYFQGHMIIAPPVNPSTDSRGKSVLGTNVPGGEKHIYVDLGKQTLYAYQGDTKVMETLIASGRWGKTPVGNFHIWSKLRATRMSGGSGDDAYDLPNVPYVMYFYHDFGLHGAYWHDNYGHTMSHGCVNMRPVDAGELFAWADGPANGQPGTPVSICNHFTEPGTCIQENPVN